MFSSNDGENTASGTLRQVTGKAVAMNKPVFSIAPALVVTVAETAGSHSFSPCALGVKFLLFFCPSVLYSSA